MFRVILWATVIHVVISMEDLLPFVKPCKRQPDPAWTECVLSAIQYNYPHFIKGNERYGLPPMDPFHVDKLLIEQGTQVFGFAIENTNVTITGIGHGRVTSAKVDLEEGTGKYNIAIPELNMVGNYFLSGKILTLYVNGSGDEVIKMNNVRADIAAKFKTYKAQSKRGVEHEYINVTELKMDLDFDSVEMQFDNLFNGNKLLENGANRFLSRNWREIFRFLGPAINRALRDSILSIANKAFQFMPFDLMFPHDFDPRNVTALN
ncbi:protein takeout-like [Periplaneta americana]|uniref:protein takeout-like n=1 Tax=Periplaneta americana TaxID=6978 RepID=UPI0037E8AC8F